MRQLKGAQARRQPLGRQRLQGGDGQNAFAGFDQVGEGGAQQADRLARRAGQALSCGGQDDLARQAAEEHLAQSPLQSPHLPAHRRLGHAKLLGGAGETLQARGGFEDADGAERKSGERI